MKRAGLFYVDVDVDVDVDVNVDGDVAEGVIGSLVSTASRADQG